MRLNGNDKHGVLMLVLKREVSILEANLSWTRKKSNSSDEKKIFICELSYFCT